MKVMRTGFEPATYGSEVEHLDSCHWTASWSLSRYIVKLSRLQYNSVNQHITVYREKKMTKKKIHQTTNSIMTTQAEM